MVPVKDWLSGAGGSRPQHPCQASFLRLVVPWAWSRLCAPAWGLADDSTASPKGPYSAHLRTLVPKTIRGIVFGTRVLKWAVYGPFGFCLLQPVRFFQVARSHGSPGCLPHRSLRRRLAARCCLRRSGLSCSTCHASRTWT